MAEIQGRLVDIYVDLAGGSTYDKIVCQTSGTVSINTPVNRTQTNCGSKVSAGVPEITISGDFVMETAPGASETSYEEILAVAVAGTAVSVKVENPSGSGTDFYHQGTAIISNLEMNWATEENVSFSCTFEVTGTLDVTPA